MDHPTSSCGAEQHSGRERDTIEGVRLSTLPKRMRASAPRGGGFVQGAVKSDIDEGACPRNEGGGGQEGGLQGQQEGERDGEREVLAVSCGFSLMHFPDDGVLPTNPRRAVVEVRGRRENTSVGCFKAP